MGLFGGMSSAADMKRDPFFNADQCYVVRITDHAMFLSRNPQSPGSTVFKIATEILETSDPDPRLQPGSGAVQLLNFKPVPLPVGHAKYQEQNLTINGPRLSDLRDHALTCLEARVIADGEANVDTARRVVNEALSGPDGGLDDEKLAEVIEKAMAENKNFVGLEIGVITTGVITKKGTPFTQIRWSANVNYVRQAIQDRLTK